VIMATATSRQAVWIAITSPVVWAIHFTICYAWAAIACGRLGATTGFSDARSGIAAVTAIAATIIAACLAYGFHRHGRRLPDQSNDDGTPGDRTRFVAFTTMLLAALSLAATLFVGFAALGFERCQ
jgi:hypothetical protein